MLSKRLEQVAQMVPQGARMADIGCDHAYLPIELVKRGQVAHAIGCDINRGPLEAADKNAQRACLDHSMLELRLGDGLNAIAPGDVDVVTIAGMGAGLMADILSARPEVTKMLSRIVVSPNVAPWILRHWAIDNNFTVANESVIYENDHYYEVFTLEPSASPVQYTELECYFGIELPRQCNETTRAYFEMRRESDERLLSAWEEVRHRREDVAAQYDRLMKLWQEWETLYLCE